MTAGGPEVGHRSADVYIVCVGVLVDVAGVCDFALGSRIDAVYLAAREALQLLYPKLLGYGIDSCMLEKLLSGLVDGG